MLPLGHCPEDWRVQEGCSEGDGEAAPVLMGACRWLQGDAQPQEVPCSPFPVTFAKSSPTIQMPYSLAPILGLLELVPFVLGVLLFEGPNPSDDLLQCLVGLLGVVDDERRVLLLFRPVVHGSAPTGFCSVGRGRRSGQELHGQPPQGRADRSHANAQRSRSRSQEPGQH